MFGVTNKAHLAKRTFGPFFITGCWILYIVDNRIKEASIGLDSVGKSAVAAMIACRFYCYSWDILGVANKAHLAKSTFGSIFTAGCWVLHIVEK